MPNKLTEKDTFHDTYLVFETPYIFSKEHRKIGFHFQKGFFLVKSKMCLPTPKKDPVPPQKVIPFPNIRRRSFRRMIRKV